MEQYFKVVKVPNQEMSSYGGGPVWKMMQMLVKGRLTRGKP